MKSTYRVTITDFHNGNQFISMNRIDGAIMLYQEIQKVKEMAVGDIGCIMLYPTEEKSIDNANAYHLLYIPNFTFPVDLGELENMQYQKFKVLDL